MVVILRQNYQRVIQRLESARSASQANQAVKLLAVSKGQSVEKIKALAALGQRAFGENYLQDALDKIQQLESLALEWHYIGAIQSNKTRQIAEHFDWVQSVDRLKTAHRLNEQRPQHLGPLQVLIQVNIDREEQKAGIDPDQADSLAREILALPNLQLRGLMGLPKAGQDIAEARNSFQALAQLFHKIQQLDAQVDTLSMGMSGDLENAVAAGSNMIRIGTALFGQREYPQ